MKFLNLSTIIISLCFSGSLQADPYCEELLSSEDIIAKYRHVGPVFSDAESGWIFTENQLKPRYNMKATSLEIVTSIAREFEKHDVELAILIAPPRPVIAGKSTLSNAMGPQESYDLKTAKISFNTLIKQLNDVGIITPNLQEIALQNSETRRDFYFRRDPHWTPKGAALSAIALANSVANHHPDLFPSGPAMSHEDLVKNGHIQEKGSLAEIVRTVCNIDVKIEDRSSFDLSWDNGAGLLGDVPEGAKIALTGSSFSNRYKRDHYRAADAISRAFHASVDNYSISGGGAMGAIESYILSGALDARAHELVIWELPYTENFNSSSALRQLLGALQLANKLPDIVPTGDIAKQVKSLDSEALGRAVGLEIILKDVKKPQIDLKIHFTNGSSSKMKLSRRSAVSPQIRARSLFASFNHFNGRTVERIEVITKNGQSQIGGLRLH